MSVVITSITYNIIVLGGNADLHTCMYVLYVLLMKTLNLLIS